MQHDYKMFKGEWTDKNSISYLSAYIREFFIGVEYFGKVQLNFNFHFNIHQYSSEENNKRFNDYLRFLRRLAKEFKTIIDISKTSSDEVYHKEITEGSESAFIIFVNSDRSYLRRLTINKLAEVSIPAMSAVRLRNLLSKLIDYINLLITESSKFMLDQEAYSVFVDNQIVKGIVNRGFKNLLVPEVPVLTRFSLAKKVNQMTEQFILKNVVFHSEIRSLEELNRTKEKYIRLINRLELYKVKLEDNLTFEDISFIGDFNLQVQEGSFLACRANTSKTTLTIGDCFRRVEFGLSNYMDEETILVICDKLLINLKAHLKDVFAYSEEIDLPDTYKELEC